MGARTPPKTPRKPAERIRGQRSDDAGRASDAAFVEDLRQRFLAFIVEQYPFAYAHAGAAFERASGQLPAGDAATARLEALAGRIVEHLSVALMPGALADEAAVLPEATPGVSAQARLSQEVSRLVASLQGFFERERIRQSIRDDERRWMLRGIILTRAVDNRMKQMFLSGELKYGELGFQGKGFRSLGQEAIFAAALRLRRGPAFEVGGAWRGDVVAPLIRDLGVVLAFTDDVALALNAQAGKAGPPLEGRDLHVGDLRRGVLPAAAPLTIATCTVTGMGLAMRLRDEDRVACSFIGEGGTSLGEWHESINLAAARKLPVIFCVQNNQTALSTPVREQSAVRVFAEKAMGYGLPALTIDGTDPEEIAAAWAWAAARARRGEGPTLIELVAMRMCGHAHHDDMLYLGGDPPLDFTIPEIPGGGYVDAERYAFWAARDPLLRYEAKLLASGVVTREDVEAWKSEARGRCDEAMREIAARPWPAGDRAGAGVFAGDAAASHPPSVALPPLPTPTSESDAVEVEDAPSYSPKGVTYLEAISRGIGDVLERVPSSFVFGEDVGAPYGNAFLLLKSLLGRHASRILNAPIAEGAIIGALVGASLEGMRPIGEMQFNDFVASGFNELVNNAAKLRYRTGLGAPFILRMPWGGLRRAGPYHSQDTIPWFYRSFGLRIVAPSTPHDARALLLSAALGDDPVLFYEHIGLYRDPKIKQLLPEEAPVPLPLGRAAFRRLGSDLSILSYGAYVHRALRVADEIAERDGASVEVLDLRSLSPLDWRAIEATTRRTGRILLVGEDSRTGSVLESLASRMGESLFEHLDAPIRVLGALDAPVPYAPSLEDEYLVSHERLLATARALLAY